MKSFPTKSQSTICCFCHNGQTVKSGQVEKLYSGDQDGAVAQDMKNLDTTGDDWGNIELGLILSMVKKNLSNSKGW